MFDGQLKKIRVSMSPALIRASIVFAMISVLTVMAIMSSDYYQQGVSSEKINATRNMQTWRTRLDKAVESKSIIERFEKDFKKLVKQGVVGDEARLDWFEQIQQTAEERGMPLVKYSISSQKKLAYENIKRAYPGIDVYKSTLSMNITMGHEGDLFALLNDLKQTSGLYTVDKCDIQKLDKKSGDSAANMTAYCELGWYTFHRSE